MVLTCIIVEDEPLALAKLKKFVLKLPFLELKATFESSIEAVMYFQTNSIDIVFLDINMSELSGIQFLETIKPSSQVILTTAYQEYALKGYELNVTDYLLKPFTFDRFLLAVEKARNNLKKSTEIKTKDFMFVKTEYRLEKVFFDDILYIEGVRDYRRIHTKSKKIMTLQTFKELEEEIPAEKIIRVHKSYMVSIKRIESIEKDEIKVGDKIIPISETYKKPFYDTIKHAKR